MPKRTPESDLGGQSSGLIKEAERIQKGGPYQEWVTSYEEEGNTDSPPSAGWLQADHRGYYQIAGKTTKGSEFSDGVLPINAQPINPSLTQKIRVGLGIVAGKLARRA